MKTGKEKYHIRDGFENKKMKIWTLLIIISIGVMSMVGIAVFGIALLTFNFDRNLDDGILPEIWEYVMSDNIERLLIQNQIDYVPGKLAVTGGPAFSGDPGCGAVIDVDSNTHWFEIDSISEPRTMTVYPENPMPCQINHSSCFCNAQTKIAEQTIDSLIYLEALKEEQIGERVKTYFETIPHEILVTKFVVGKYHLDLGERYDEICGILLTENDREEKFNVDYSTYAYFSTAKEGQSLWDFSLSVGSEKLCAIRDDAKIFEYEKSDG